MKSRLLLDRLLDGESIATAADAVGMSRRTAYRRLANSEFRDALSQSRSAVVAGVVARLAGSAERVTDVLLSLIEDPNCPPSVRGRSCQAWLAALQEYGEVESLASRVAQLEEALERVRAAA